MPYNESTYCGDNIYCINVTGDCCTGDEVKFERAVFCGSFRKPKFSHFETIEGKIVNDSYGKDKQQHTFTILLTNGQKIKIKGRNLYRNGVWRKPWTVEEFRKIAIQEKHNRGDIARKNRENRRNLFLQSI